MSESKRMDRVQSELLRILGLHLQHGLKQPLPCYASITAVEVHPDLRSAKVFFRLVGGANATNEAQDILLNEKSHFQKEVAAELKTKFCPVLRFEFGVAPHMDDIDKMLADLRRRRDPDEE